jgi:hypothetical protein
LLGVNALVVFGDDVPQLVLKLRNLLGKKGDVGVVVGKNLA